jgi:hypothetical protein
MCLPAARNDKTCRLAEHVKRGGVLCTAALTWFAVSRMAPCGAFARSALRLVFVARSAITLIRLTAAPAYMITTALRTEEGAGGRWTACVSVPPG